MQTITVTMFFAESASVIEFKSFKSENIKDFMCK